MNEKGFSMVLSLSLSFLAECKRGLIVLLSHPRGLSPHQAALNRAESGGADLLQASARQNPRTWFGHLSWVSCSFAVACTLTLRVDLMLTFARASADSVPQPPSVKLSIFHSLAVLTMAGWGDEVWKDDDKAHKCT